MYDCYTVDERSARSREKTDFLSTTQRVIDTLTGVVAFVGGAGPLFTSTHIASAAYEQQGCDVNMFLILCEQ